MKARVPSLLDTHRQHIHVLKCLLCSLFYKTLIAFSCLCTFCFFAVAFSAALLLKISCIIVLHLYIVLVLHITYI